MFPLGEESDDTNLPSGGQGEALRARKRARKGNDLSETVLHFPKLTR